MSVYPRADGIYVYDFQIQRVRFFGSTGSRARREAEQFEKARRKEARKNLAKAREQRIGPMTVNAAFDRFWLEVGEGYSGNYADVVWNGLEWMLAELGANTLIRDIGPNRITEMIAKRRAPDPETDWRPSNATVNRSVTELLRRILRRAGKKWEQEVQTIEWAEHLLPEPKERIRELRDTEETALFDKMRQDYAPAILFLMITGLRKRELLGLRWADVDWTTKTLAVRGKGDKAATIPLTRLALAILSALRGNHPTTIFTYVCRRPRRDPVRVRGQRYPITLSGLNTTWRRYGGPAADLDDFRLHDLRHTAATRLLRSSGNLKLVQKLLRHADISTTIKYAHATDEDLRRAMESADKARRKRDGKSRKKSRMAGGTAA